jgi:hypothetical protein
MKKKIKEELFCAECGKLIQTRHEDDTYELVTDQGPCRDCGYVYCSDCLNIPAGVFSSPWGVSYRGYSCKKCLVSPILSSSEWLIEGDYYEADRDTT